MANLIGIHDIEGIAITPQDSWILDTVALSENPAGKVYSSSFHWIVRVNYGYGSTGTIPLPDKDSIFISRLAQFVSVSSGCHRWIIGNEPNLAREWPNNQAIHPYRYAEFYQKCRDVIKKLPGHDKDEILIAASGPWNADYKYAGNEKGDWINYFTDVIGAMPQDKIDGFSIHAYTHGYDRNLAWSEATMDAPFQNRHYNFRTYQDYCNAIPDSLAHLPIYITEANGNSPWHAAGLMPAMAAEINNWNKNSAGRKILSLIFYRYPDYDSGIKFHMVGKPDVIQEYKRTAESGYRSPELPQKILLPHVPNEAPPGKWRTAVVTATKLNVRNRAGVSGTEIVGYKLSGDKIFILEEITLDGSVWYRIGKDQWVAASWTDDVTQGDKPDTRSNWERVKEFTGGWEGGFQKFDWDPGNWTGCEVGKGNLVGTNFGISACSYPGLDIPSITKQQAEEIYFRDYWQRSGADKLPWPMCLLVYDTAVNFHPTTAAAWLKESNGSMLRFCAFRFRGYRKSRAWPQAHNAWTDRMIDLMLEISE